jgi:hypothetical protein
MVLIMVAIMIVTLDTIHGILILVKVTIMVDVMVYFMTLVAILFWCVQYTGKRHVKYRLEIFRSNGSWIPPGTASPRVVVVVAVVVILALHNKMMNAATCRFQTSDRIA